MPVKKEQRAFLVFVVVAGLFITYWAVSPFLNNFKTEKNKTQPSQDSLSNNAGNKIPPSFQYYASLFSTSTYQSTGKNFTQSIVDDISSDFIAYANPKTRPTTSLDEFIKNGTSSKSVDDKLSKIYAEADLVFIENYPLSKIKSFSNSTQGDKLAYWNAYTGVFQDQMDMFVLSQDVFQKALSDAFEKNNFSKLDELILKNETALRTIKEANVPVEFVDFHAQNLAFLSNFVAVLHSFKKINSDPIGSYIVIEKGLPLISNQIDSVVSDYNQLKKRYNL